MCTSWARRNTDVVLFVVSPGARPEHELPYAITSVDHRALRVRTAWDRERLRPVAAISTFEVLPHGAGPGCPPPAGRPEAPPATPAAIGAQDGGPRNLPHGAVPVDRDGSPDEHSNVTVTS